MGTAYSWPSRGAYKYITVGLMEIMTKAENYHITPTGTFSARLLTGWWIIGRKYSSTWDLLSGYLMGA